MIRVLMPISIDRWTASISTQMRAVVSANPEIEFHCFSNPRTDEDKANGKAFWALPNVVRRKQLTGGFHYYDIVQLGALSGKNITASVMSKARSLGQTHVTSMLCVEIVPEDSYGWRWYQAARHVADSFLGVSAVAGERARLDEPEKYMGVIHNGYDPAYFSPETEPQPELLPEAVRAMGPRGYFLWVSALEPRKRPEVLIEMARRMPDVQFVAAGYIIPNSGETYAEQIGRLPNVTWLGLVDRSTLRELFRNANGLIFPSEREGLPLAVIEAMGMGLQTLAQPKTSLPELIQHGHNGWLIDESKPDEWEAACRELLSQTDSTWEAKAKAIHQETVVNRSWHAAGRKYGDYYRLVMQKRERDWRLQPGFRE
jgi:glycosyltransferase involved in cell wall biosynthesis